MANLHVKDGDSASKYVKTDGVGTDGNPYVPHHVLDSGHVGILDGEDAAQGAVADPMVGAGAVGSISAKLRRVTQALADLETELALKADLTETQPVSLASLPTGGVTIAEGADVTSGSVGDPMVAAGAPGTVSAKLRRITQALADLETELALKADLTETQPTSLADGADVTSGSVGDAIVDAGAVGTISAKLRRVTQGLADLETELALKADLGETQPTSLADGADVTSGSIADAIVAAGAVGTISAKLRRVTQGLADLETELALKADLTDTQPASLADGAHVSSGSIADDMVAAGAVGTISAKLRRISSDLDAVKSAVETIDNAISGNEMQADIVTQPAAEQTTPTFYNVTLAGADTEYVQALPANTRALQFQCRTAYDVRYAFETGKVATPTSPYSTLKSGAVWWKENIKTSGSLYLASSQAGVVAEIESWA